MYIGVQSSMNPDIGFILEVTERIDEAKRLIKEGFETWICLDFPTEYYTDKDYDWLIQCGYAEPSIDLLDRFGIPHSSSYECFDEEGNLTEEWKDVEIEWVYY